MQKKFNVIGVSRTSNIIIKVHEHQYLINVFPNTLLFLCILFISNYLNVIILYVLEKNAFLSHSRNIKTFCNIPIIQLKLLPETKRHHHFALYNQLII